MTISAGAGTPNIRQLHKFGGSSLADARCYQRVAGIMADYSQPGDLMVVSAAGSTTNQLISWLKLSQSDRLSAHQVQQALRRYQSELISALLPAEVAEPLITAFIRDLEKLAALLDAPITDAVYAEVVGHGEVWSARLMSAVLSQRDLQACWLDAREFLRAERAAQPQVDEGKSWPLLQTLLAQHPHKRIVVTGFISRNDAGETVLLGRNGSDYSATQIGALAGVGRVTPWSDVGGGGEGGRGLAVVAGEVRSVASRSANAAKEIKGLIEESVSRVQQGSALVDTAAKTMHEIVTSVTRVNDIMGEIASASDEQRRGIEQVAQAVSQMDQVTQQNASLVEEAAAATDQLASQADHLTGLVAVFNVKEHVEAVTEVGRSQAVPVVS